MSDAAPEQGKGQMEERHDQAYREDDGQADGGGAAAEKKPENNDSVAQPGKLFIGGLSWETTDKSLREHFSQYGELTDVVVMKDKFSGHPRGFGFVTFKEYDVAAAAVQETHTLDGRQVDAKLAVPRESMGGAPNGSQSSGSGGWPRDRPPVRTKKVFVGGISHGVSEEDFKQYFEKYGEVVDSVIMKDHETGRSRGFGFVTFESEDPVEVVLAESHTLDNKMVEIKKAEPRKEMPRGGGGGRDMMFRRGPPMPMRGGGMGMRGMPPMGMRYPDPRDAGPYGYRSAAPRGREPRMLEPRYDRFGPPDGMRSYGRSPYSEPPSASPYAAYDPPGSYGGGRQDVGYGNAGAPSYGSGASVDPYTQPTARPSPYEDPYAATASSAYGAPPAAGGSAYGAPSRGYPSDTGTAASAYGAAGYDDSQSYYNSSSTAGGGVYGATAGAYGSSSGIGGANVVTAAGGGGVAGYGSAVSGYGSSVSASTGRYASGAYGAGAADPASYGTPAQSMGRVDRSYHPYR